MGQQEGGQGSPRPQGGKTSLQRWPARPGVSVCMYVHVCLPVNMYMDTWARVTGSGAWEHVFSAPRASPEPSSLDNMGHLHTHLSFQGRPLLDMDGPRYEVVPRCGTWLLAWPRLWWALCGMECSQNPQMHVTAHGWLLPLAQGQDAVGLRCPRGAGV